MISTQQIAYILAVSETNSISRAAELCFVTQPTLSMQLKKAEEDLGFTIFNRDSSNLELTSFGLELIPLLRQIQGDLGAIKRLTEQFSGTYKEQLRIGVIPTVAAYLLLDVYTEWQKILPETQVFIEELKTNELLEALDNRKIDLAILAGPVSSSNLRITPLFEEEILAFAPNERKNELNVGELQELHPWLLTKGNCLRTQMMSFCDLNDDEPATWNYSGGNIDLLMKMVELHGGYTLVPEFHLFSNPYSLKRIVDIHGNHPGRSVIALSAFRHSKWDTMEKIIRSIQLKYGKQRERELELLSW